MTRPNMDEIRAREVRFREALDARTLYEFRGVIKKMPTGDLEHLRAILENKSARNHGFHLSRKYRSRLDTIDAELGRR